MRGLGGAWLLVSLVAATSAFGEPAALVPPGSAPALLNESIVFYAGFDRERLAADLAAGRAEPLRVEGQPRFVEGRFGRAVVLGTAGGGVRLTYAGVSQLDFRRPGALSVWVRPIDWKSPKAARRGYVKFVSVGANPSGSFVVQRMGFNRSTRRPDALIVGMFDLPSTKLFYLQLNDTESWGSDEWHLVVVNWDRHGIELSLDGGALLRRSAPNGLEVEAFGRSGSPAPFMIGNPSDETTAMDELTLYAHPLEAEDVQRLFRADSKP